jgi:hypothetical protein
MRSFLLFGALFSQMSLAASVADLATLKAGSTLTLQQVPVGFGEQRDFELWRFEPYASDSKIWLDTPAGLRELPRSTRQFFIGRSTDGQSRMALSTDALGGDVQAEIFMPRANFEARWVDGQWQVLSSQQRVPDGETLSFQCGNEQLQSQSSHNFQRDSLLLDPPSPQTDVMHGVFAQRAPLTTLATRSARVSFDVDNFALNRKFSNNTTTATNYLASLITNMNVTYDAPLNVQLLVGTSFIRAAGVPLYTTENPDLQVLLNQLGEQWRVNHTAVPRSFVMLIAGSQSNGCSGAGLAWIDAFCQNGTPFGGGNVYGSYSVNQLFHTACAGVAISNDLRIAAHELGHNFAAPHTHCTTTGFGIIDQCFNQEGGCYSGATSCPAGGGSLMSYCHLLGGCSASLQFHPSQISFIAPKTNAATTSGCFQNASATDTILNSGFE